MSDPAGDAALDHPDDGVRRDAAVRLVLAGLAAAERPQVMPALERAPTAALVTAARAPDRAKRLAALVPLLGAALADAGSRQGPFALLLEAASSGVDLSAAMPAIVGLLADPERAGRAADLVRAVAWTAGSPDDAEAPLARLLASPDPFTAYAAGGALATRALVAGDADGLLTLAHHPTDPVREGCANALEVAAIQGRPVQSGFGALAVALGDPASAVAWHAVQTLDRLAAAGVELDPVIPALKHAQERLVYTEDGWTFGYWRTTGDTRMDDHRPRAHARVIEVTHLLMHQRWDEVQAALAGPTDQAAAARSAVRTFVASAAHEADRQRAASLLPGGRA